jgi:hypothetical protein
LENRKQKSVCEDEEKRLLRPIIDLVVGTKTIPEVNRDRRAEMRRVRGKEEEREKVEV